MRQPYEDHEKYVQEILGLDSTIASGRLFVDPGDGVSREHYLDQRYRLYAEAKSTSNKAFALKRDIIAQYARRAAEYGKMFCLPIRFIYEGGAADYVLLRLIDFSDILDSAQCSPEQREAQQYLTWIIDKIADSEIQGEARTALERLIGD